MKTRRHHNTKGAQQVKRGKTRTQVAHIARRVGLDLPVWNVALGFWEWACGCLRFQDGYTLCKKHKRTGYTALKH